MLAHVLTKAEAFAKEKNIPEAEFVNSSLAPDMKPLWYQITLASREAKNSIVHLSNMPVDRSEVDYDTFQKMQDQIAAMQEILKGVTKESVASDLDSQILVGPEGRQATMTKWEYVQTIAIPNFFFHIVTTYGILRMKGVNVGKFDYIRPLMAQAMAKGAASA